jgi:hypothetical protein
VATAGPVNLALTRSALAGRTRRPLPAQLRSPAR